MRKSESTLAVKTLVRNPEQPVPKTIGVIPSKETNSSEIGVNSTSSTNFPNKVVGYKSKPQVKFNVPERYSSLKLSRKIDEIKNPRKSKTMPDLTKSTADEKLGRQMNFSHTERVFEDLIPLAGFEGKEQPRIAPRNVNDATRDKEPVLADYLEPIKSRSYLCKPRVFDLVEDEEENGPIRNGLDLYKYMQIFDGF
ncbi:uncharacterized protein LOC109539013 [Dendroctonus ponderosae]